MSEVPNPSMPAEAASPSATGRDAVLLIEDNETIVGLLTAILRGMRLRVFSCADGAQAQAVFAEHKDQILLVLADCRLPDADGRELCLKFREVVPDLPVLVTSGSVSGRGVAPLPRSSLVEYLPKPYAPSEVLNKVRRLIDAAGGSRVAGEGFV
jgi:two-component system cell cycle sensor histidine kinase/response regulator CckA